MLDFTERFYIPQTLCDTSVKRICASFQDQAEDLLLVRQTCKPLHYHQDRYFCVPQYLCTLLLVAKMADGGTTGVTVETLSCMLKQGEEIVFHNS